MEVRQVLQANATSIAWCGAHGGQRGVFEYLLPCSPQGSGAVVSKHACVLDCSAQMSASSSPKEVPAAFAWNRRQTLVAVATGPSVTVATWPGGKVLYTCTPVDVGANVTHVTFDSSDDEQDAVFFATAYPHHVCFARLPRTSGGDADRTDDVVAVDAAIALEEGVVGMACVGHQPMSCCVVLAHTVLAVGALPSAASATSDEPAAPEAPSTTTAPSSPSYELHRSDAPANDEMVLGDSERFIGCGVGPHHTTLVSTNRRLWVHAFTSAAVAGTAAPSPRVAAVVPLDALADRADELCSVAWDPWAGDAVCVVGVWTIDRCLRVYHALVDADGRVRSENDFLGELSPLSGDEDVVWCGALGPAKSVVIARRMDYGFMGLDALTAVAEVDGDGITSTGGGEGVVVPLLDKDAPCEDSVEVADGPLDASQPEQAVEDTHAVPDVPAANEPPTTTSEGSPVPPIVEKGDDAADAATASEHSAAQQEEAPPTVTVPPPCDTAGNEIVGTTAAADSSDDNAATLASAVARTEQDASEPIPQTDPSSNTAPTSTSQHADGHERGEVPIRDEEAATSAPPPAAPPPQPDTGANGGKMGRSKVQIDGKPMPSERRPLSRAQPTSAATAINSRPATIKTRPVSPSIPPPEKKPAVPRLSESLKRQSRAERLANRSAEPLQPSAAGSGMGVAAPPAARDAVPPRGPGVDVALDTDDLLALRDSMDVYVLTKLLGEGWETPVSFIPLPPQVKLADLRRRLEALHKRRLSITFATTDGKLIELRPSTLNLFQNYDDATKQIYCRGLFPTFPAKSKWDGAEQRAHSAMDSRAAPVDEFSGGGGGFGHPRSATPGDLHNVSAISTGLGETSGIDEHMPRRRLTKEEQALVSTRLHETSMEQAKNKVEMLTKRFWPEEAHVKSIPPEAATEMIERLYRRSNEHKAKKIQELQKTVDASIFGTKPHVQLTEAERHEVAMKFYNAGVRQAQQIAEKAERRQHPKPRCKKLSGPEEWAAWQESMSRDIGKKFKTKDPYAGA